MASHVSGMRGQALLEDAAVAAQAVARVDAVQHVGAAGLGQRTDEEDVADVAGRLLPAAFLEVGDDGVEHGLPSASGTRPAARAMVWAHWHEP